MQNCFSIAINYISASFAKGVSFLAFDFFPSEDKRTNPLNVNSIIFRQDAKKSANKRRGKQKEELFFGKIFSKMLSTYMIKLKNLKYWKLEIFQT